MTFVRKDKYYEQSSVDPHYTVCAVKTCGRISYEAWVKTRTDWRHMAQIRIGGYDTAIEARKAAIKHKLESIENEQCE